MLIEVSPHIGILAALTSEQKGDFTVFADGGGKLSTGIRSNFPKLSFSVCSRSRHNG